MTEFSAKGLLDGVTQLQGLFPNVATLHQVVLSGDNSFWIDTRDLERYASDPIGFCAKHYKTTRERFLGWLAYVEDDMPCSGITKKGDPCRSHGLMDVSSDRFAPGITDRCFHHVEIVSTDNPYRSIT